MKSSKDKYKWTVNSLDTFLKKSLNCEIYFDDIETVWNYWGGNKYI